MLTAILIILIVLWFLGYGPLEAFYVPLFTYAENHISLWDILIFAVVLGLIGMLPGPLRVIIGVLLLLWLLSVLGILAFSGLQSMVVIAIIVGLIFYILGGR